MSKDIPNHLGSCSLFLLAPAVRSRSLMEHNKKTRSTTRGHVWKGAVCLHNCPLGLRCTVNLQGRGWIFYFILKRFAKSLKKPFLECIRAASGAAPPPGTSSRSFAKVPPPSHQFLKRLFLGLKLQPEGPPSLQLLGPWATGPLPELEELGGGRGCSG